jgi:hypothetical protein
MDCPISNNGTVFGIHDWLNYLRDQAAKCRKLVEQADDPLVKTELLALASVCEVVPRCVRSQSVLRYSINAFRSLGDRAGPTRP